MNKRTCTIIVFFLLCLNTVPLSAQEKFDPGLFATRAEFSLDDRKITTESAVVVLTDEFFSGQTQALKILFVTEPITAAGKMDALTNDGKILRQKDHVIMVLFIDNKNVIWQVNLTYVIPGRTVVRTVAWKPEELQQFHTEYDGEHLKLKCKANYSEPASEQDAVTLTWDVDLDAPVFNILKAKM